eukprot:4158303-Lingulodinium_polyedra.AAC.1
MLLFCGVSSPCPTVRQRPSKLPGKTARQNGLAQPHGPAKTPWQKRPVRQNCRAILADKCARQF